MTAPRSHGLPSPTVCAVIVVAMIAIIAVPAAITLHTVRSPARLVASSQDPTPYGYTVSLLLFIIPDVSILVWFLRNEELHFPRRAFVRTIAILVPLFCALDFFFAQYFFEFPNAGATLCVHAFALGKPVPIEEYVFYFTGALADLLLYVWLGEFWVAAYNVIDYPGEVRKISGGLRQFHPPTLIVAAVLIGVAWLYKKHFAGPADQAGFPGYFAFLVIGGVLPGLFFYSAARRFINWRAFSLTLFFMLLVSLIWEATLALPYGWWSFQHPQMIGLFIGAWSGLPIEEIFVWIGVTYATVIVFEVIKVLLASERSVRETLLGAK
jgi:hypothetical protein